MEYRLQIKILSIAILCFTIAASALVFSVPVHADPAPNTSSFYLILPKDVSTATSLPGELYLPWPAIITLLDEKTTSSGDPTNIDFSKYIGQYDAYLQKHLILTNNGSRCSLKLSAVPKQSQDDIYFGLGVQINTVFTCAQSFGTLLLKNDMFSDVPMQQNTVQVSREKRDALIQLTVLTPEVTEMQIGNVTDVSAMPSTGTSIPIASVQTNVLMNQLTKKLTTVPFWLMLVIVFVLGFLHTAEVGHSKTILSAALIDKKVDFKQAVMFSAVFTGTHVADIIVMGIILLVANSFVDVFSKLPYLQIFSSYCLLFVSLYMLLQSLAHFVQTKLKKKSGINVGFLEEKAHTHVGLADSQVLLGNEQLHSHGGVEHSHATLEEFLDVKKKSDFRHQLVMGIIAGIAPCLFGWSIFMVVLSTHKVWTIFPVIGMFALGIFVALLLFAVIITKLKSTVFAKASWIGELSPIISAGILVAYAVWMLV